MKSKLTSNLLLKLISVLFAIVLWLVVVNISDPTITATISRIKVDIEGETLITGDNKVYSIEQGETATITIKGPRSIVEQLTSSDFTARAPFKEKSTSDAVPIYVEHKNPKYEKSVEIIQKTRNMLLVVEDLVTDVMTIEYECIGEPAEGYQLGSISLGRSQVRVSLPKSLSEKLNKAVVEIELTGENDDLTMKSQIKLYDTSDREITNSKNVSLNIETVDVSVSILAMKEVILDISTSGEAAPGMIATGIEYSPRKITIAGKKDILSGINSITIPDEVLDITGAIGDVPFTIDINSFLPDGIVLADIDQGTTGEIEIIVRVEAQTTKQYTLPVEEIKLKNLADDYYAKFEDEKEISFMLIGLQADLDAFDISMLNAEIDLSGVNLGENNLLISLNIPGNLTLAENVYGNITISEVQQQTEPESETTTESEQETTTESRETTSAEAGDSETTKPKATADPDED